MATQPHHCNVDITGKVRSGLVKLLAASTSTGGLTKTQLNSRTHHSAQWSCVSSQHCLQLSLQLACIQATFLSHSPAAAVETKCVWGAGLGVIGGYSVLVAHNSLYRYVATRLLERSAVGCSLCSARTAVGVPKRGSYTHCDFMFLLCTCCVSAGWAAGLTPLSSTLVLEAAARTRHARPT